MLTKFHKDVETIVDFLVITNFLGLCGFLLLSLYIYIFLLLYTYWIIEIGLFVSRIRKEIIEIFFRYIFRIKIFQKHLSF